MIGTRSSVPPGAETRRWIQKYLGLIFVIFAGVDALTVPPVNVTAAEHYK